FVRSLLWRGAWRRRGRACQCRAYVRVKLRPSRAWLRRLSFRLRRLSLGRLDQREIIAVDHLLAALKADRRRDLGALFARNLPRVVVIMGDEPARDSAPTRCCHRYRIAALKASADRFHPRRQKAIAALQRACGAFVNDESALRRERTGNPVFARLRGRSRS